MRKGNRAVATLRRAMLSLLLLQPLLAMAASAPGDPGTLGTVKDSQQIAVPESNRAYDAPATMTGTGPASETLARLMKPTLEAAFSGGTVELVGDMTQTGQSLFSKGKLGNSEVSFRVDFSSLGVALKAVADYDNGPILSGVSLPGSRPASLQGLYLPGNIMDQARIDVQTVTLNQGLDPAIINMGFKVASNIKFLDDKGLLIELVDSTVGLEYDQDSGKVAGVIGGSLRVGVSSAPVTFTARAALGTSASSFEVVGTAEKINFVAMLKGMAPKGSFDDFPVPIDALSQFATVDLAKITIRPAQRSVNIFATSALAAIEISFKENEVYAVTPSKDPDPLEISTALTGSYAKPPQPPPPPAPDTSATGLTGGYAKPAPAPAPDTSATGLTGGYTKPAPPPNLPPPGTPPPPAPVMRKDMGFMLALQPLPTFKFASIVPELKIVDQLNFVKGAIVYSTFRGEAAPDSQLAAFKNWSPSTLISPGLTVLVVADIKDLRQAGLDRALGGSGIAGKVANGFLDTAQVIVDASPVKQLVFRANVPRQMSNFSLDLLATLATPRIGTVLDFRDISISVKPLAMTVEIGGTIDMKFPKAVTSAERLIFTGGIAYEMPTTALISGAMKSDITDLFGVKGLRIGRSGFSAGLNFEADGIPIPDNMQIVGGLGLSFGRDRVVFEDASFALGFDINKPDNLALVFNLQSLSWQNLITGFAGKNVLSRFEGTPGLKQILKTDLNDLQFQLAMPGFTFVSKTGYSFTGSRIAGRGRLAGLGGRFDIAIESLRNPLVAEVELDKLKLPSVGDFEVFTLSSYDGKGGAHAAVNLTMANIGSGVQKPLVSVDGKLAVLGIESRTLMEFNGSEFSGVSEGKIYGVLDGKLEFSGPSFDNPLDSFYIKATLDVDKVGREIMGVASKVATLGTLAVKIKSITFEGKLGVLKGGAKAKVVLHFNPVGGESFDRTISVNIDAADALHMIEKIGQQVGEEIKKIALVAVKAVAQAAGDVWEVVSGGPKVWGKTAQQIFDAVENVFDPDDRKRLKLDGPQFRVSVQSTGNVMVPIGLDGRSGVRTMKSRGNAYYEELWQLVPSEEDGRFYLVSAWDGQDLNVKESSTQEGAQILLQKHKKQDKANEKLLVIPIEGQEEGWVRLQFKHSNLYVGVNAAGQLVQTAKQDASTAWRFDRFGDKVWGDGGPRPSAEQVAASVIVFQKENFAGAWLPLHEGDNALGVPFANDVASIKVPDGFLVTLRDKFECTPKDSDLRLVTDASSMRGSGLQNDIACVNVRRSGLPATFTARLFTQPNYGGVSRDIGVGRFPLGDVFRNRIGSIRVAAGFQATLHDKADCTAGPDSLVVVTERPAFAGTGLVDDVACVVVEKAATSPPAGATAPAPSSVQAFVDENYGGAMIALGVGQHVLPDTMKNKVSSVKVPAGMKAVLVDKDDCVSSGSLTVTTDLPNLKGTGLNDDVACIIVTK